MAVDRTTLIFFDASCLIAAAGSRSGGSSFLLSLCTRKLLRGAVSQPVLVEAETNISRKMNAAAIDRFRLLLTTVPFVVVPVPSPEETGGEAETVNAKDAHVLAAALAAETPYLLSLDAGLIHEIAGATLSFPIQALAQLPQFREYQSGFCPSSGAVDISEAR